MQYDVVSPEYVAGREDWKHAHAGVIEVDSIDFSNDGFGVKDQRRTGGDEFELADGGDNLPVHLVLVPAKLAGIQGIPPKEQIAFYVRLYARGPISRRARPGNVRGRTVLMSDGVR